MGAPRRRRSPSAPPRGLRPGLLRLGGAVLVVGGGVVVGMSVSAYGTSGAPHIMVVMMENQGYSQVIGNSAMPYTDSLASDYGLATQSYALAHPSLPNYLALVSGSAQGVTTDESPPSTLFGGQTLANQLEAAGDTVGLFAENLPGDPSADSGDYAVHHNPWEYFAGQPAVQDASGLVSSLDSTSAPDFVWYTPNTEDDGDGESTESASVAGEEAFLSSFIPEVQATSWYAAGGQIVIEWDEGLDTDTSGIDGGAGGHVLTIVVSNALQAAPQQDATSVDTVGVLDSIEDAYGLAHLAAGTGTIDSLLAPGLAVTTTSGTAASSTTTAAPTTTTTQAQDQTTTSTTAPTTTTTQAQDQTTSTTGGTSPTTSAAPPTTAAGTGQGSSGGGGGSDTASSGPLAVVLGAGPETSPGAGDDQAATVVPATSGALAFTGAGPGIGTLTLVGGALVLVGMALLALVGWPRRRATPLAVRDGTRRLFGP